MIGGDVEVSQRPDLAESTGSETTGGLEGPPAGIHGRPTDQPIGLLWRSCEDGKKLAHPPASLHPLPPPKK